MPRACPESEKIGAAAWTTATCLAVITAYTLDGAHSIELSGNIVGSVPDGNGSFEASLSVDAVTGSVFSAPDGKLVVSGRA